MKAKLLFHERFSYVDGSFVEMRIWRVPTPVPPTTHGLKYSLFYGRDGKRLLGYDNERGKGDHKHIGELEMPYRFRSVERLVADFLADIDRVRRR